MSQAELTMSGTKAGADSGKKSGRESGFAQAERLTAVLASYMPMTGVFLAYVLGVNILLAAYGLNDLVSYEIYKLPFLLSLGFVLFVKLASYVLRHGRYAFSRRALRDLYIYGVHPSALARIFIPFVMISFFMSVFSSVKTLLPAINPFYLDEFFMQADRFLHFGVHPWQITHALFGDVMSTRVLDFFYRLWFLFLMFHALWMIVHHRRLGKIHHQYLLTYFLSWSVLGSLMAITLSAAGPCFYGNIVDGPDVFFPLMARLQEIAAAIGTADGKMGLSALEYQKLLWDYYTDGELGLGSGITAMPSMHVAFAMLLFLSSRAFNRPLGYVMLAYLIIIQIGSVHLGWHYAVDGYVSMLGTWGLWRFSGWLVDRYQAYRTRRGTPLPQDSLR